MGKYNWLNSWPRFLLWSHVIGVVGFYAVIWWRTAPDKNDYVRKLPPQPAQEPASSPLQPRVSIIVPARNEERNIRRCVTSLLEQDYPNYEVIVVDDGSTDATASILDELVTSHPRGERLWILRLRDLPPGWAGKPHAIQQGVQEARGEWLLFTDADTWHAPNALSSTLAQARQEQVDLFTIASTQELPTFWEKTLMPMAFLGISMLYPPRLVNDPSSPVAVANGQYILIRRQAYEQIGGYARPELRDTLLDDRDLARVVKENGFKLKFVEGSGLLRVRMYHGLRDTWRGWRKNAFLGNRGGLAFVLTQLFGLPMISIVPFLLPLLARLVRTKRSVSIGLREVGAAMGLELGAIFAYRTWLNRQMSVPWYTALTHPLAGAIFEGILAQSAWRIVTRRGVDWRGRQYHNERQRSAG
ncbi:glycosyltransferase [Ktedonosporobacter rubrisoli]|uniref:Glycosyltransferase n=1 Tax=Ktedonosporobacter rubrisoli TaxID=2509675 RepID=A0A4P6JWZ4_KTERU|nr:glycosyltransferase [Ktedonosporobacter rubrisoli]QBD79546.1 glycosyltransferase [Ktedonosporobacter rubrisoli]